MLGGVFLGIWGASGIATQGRCTTDVEYEGEFRISMYIGDLIRFGDPHLEFYIW